MRGLPVYPYAEGKGNHSLHSECGPLKLSGNRYEITEIFYLYIIYIYIHTHRHIPAPISV